MHDDRTHPYLQQIPLTVSPFVNLPTATTLPYRYKPMPSTLPPSILGSAATATADPTDDPQSASNGASADGLINKPKYVVSPSGHAAHPDDILASCRALHEHVSRLVAQAEKDLAAAEERIRARELAEKRRVAPGWLDSDARLLEPERKSTPASGTVGGEVGDSHQQHQSVQGWSVGGSAFGGIGTEGGPSEMEVPDTGEQLDRVFGGLKIGGSGTS
ncbi:hypothetical protein VTJ04DRAFT_7591 [Mycothermus thermophilus]|uniref:uncharacterized protein n=1 Tax=Humicola insolens TaxID=85995 RepID=UPI00374459C6